MSNDGAGAGAVWNHSMVLASLLVLPVLSSRAAEQPTVPSISPLDAQKRKVKAIRAFRAAAESRLEALDRKRQPPVEARKLVSDPEEVYKAVQDIFRTRYDLEWLGRLGFDNTYVLVMRREQANELGITSISELADHVERDPGELRFGFDHEFRIRDDGYPGLARHYGFKRRPLATELDIGRLYKALAAGEVDVIDGFNTDGCALEPSLAILADDKSFFPPYEGAPLVRAELFQAPAHPEMRRILSELAGRLPEEQMRLLNREADEKGRGPAQAAEGFVARLGADREKTGGGPPAVKVAGKHFIEQSVLCHVMGEWIRRRSDVQVEVKPDYGGTMSCFWGLVDRKIDVYAEYTGTALYNILRQMDQDELEFCRARWEKCLAQEQAEQARLWEGLVSSLEGSAEALDEGKLGQYVSLAEAGRQARAKLPDEERRALREYLRTEQLKRERPAPPRAVTASELSARKNHCRAEEHARKALQRSIEYQRSLCEYADRTWAVDEPAEEFRALTRLRALAKLWRDGVEALKRSLEAAENDYARHREVLSEATTKARDANAKRFLSKQESEATRSAELLGEYAGVADDELSALAGLVRAQERQLAACQERLEGIPAAPAGPAEWLRVKLSSNEAIDAQRLAEEAEALNDQIAALGDMMQLRRSRTALLAAERELTLDIYRRLRQQKETEAYELLAAERMMKALNAVAEAAPQDSEQFEQLCPLLEVQKTVKGSDAKSKRRQAREAVYRWMVAGVVLAVIAALTALLMVLMRGKTLRTLRRILVILVWVIGVFIIMVQFPTLQRIGFTFLASAGVAGVIVGMAARSTLANAFSAITLCFSRPFRIDDWVMIGDEYGTIEEVGLIYTTFRTWDNRRLMIPNELMTNRDIVNYTKGEERLWAKVPIMVDYCADIEKVRTILIEAAKDSKHWNRQEEPRVWLMETGEHGIVFWVAAWADDPPKAWMLRCDIRDNALTRFRQEGIPLPRRRYQRLEADAVPDKEPGRQPPESPAGSREDVPDE